MRLIIILKGSNTLHVLGFNFVIKKCIILNSPKDCKKCYINKIKKNYASKRQIKFSYS